jgi:transcriptional regulator with XRE-family HTH domain
MKPKKNSKVHQIDVQVGRRIRRRRWLRGLTQQELGQAIGVAFQQVQKYESGSDRISASRLFSVAKALDVPVDYFFDELALDVGGDPDDQPHWREREAMLLIRYYVNMSEQAREQLLGLLQSLQDK